MKLIHTITAIIIISLMVACGTTDPPPERRITSGDLNYEIAISKNVSDIQSATDPFSMHIDSILSGLIDTELISTGVISFDLNDDNQKDIGFEIIDLLVLNNNNLPEELDSLAVRVIPCDMDIMDSSTFGYADALDEYDNIDADGIWSETRPTLVLGTFANAGQFNGQGWKHLGFRMKSQNEYNYGWVNVYVSTDNDTIKIGEYAFNEIPNSNILAGQKD